jgi:hypothetical protein
MKNCKRNYIFVIFIKSNEKHMYHFYGVDEFPHYLSELKD